MIELALAVGVFKLEQWRYNRCNDVISSSLALAALQ